MKKKLLFTLLALIGCIGAWAQTVVTTPNVSTSETRYRYTLHCKATDHGGSYLGIVDDAFNGRCAEENAVEFEFEAGPADGQYYLRSVDLGYVTADGGNITFENTPSTYWTINPGEGWVYLLANGQNGVYLNNNKTTGDGIKTAAGTGDCSHWVLTEYVTQAQPLSWSEVKNGYTYAIVNVQPSTVDYKKYYLNSTDGNLTPVDATGFTSISEWPTTAQFVAEQQPNGTFAFKNVANNQYLAYKSHNTGENDMKGFVDTVEDWSSWTMNASTRSGFEGTYWPVCAKRSSTNTTVSTLLIANNGSWNAWTNSECTNTGYSNNYGFVELAAPTTYSYNVIVLGHGEGKAIVNEVEYANGANLNDLSQVLTLAEITAKAVDGYTSTVSLSGVNITITYHNNGSAIDLDGKQIVVGEKTQAITPDNQWYVLTQIRDGESPAYDNGTKVNRAAAANTLDVLFSAGTVAAERTQYLLRFLSTNVDGAYEIQFANGKYWNGVTTSANVEDAKFYFVHAARQTTAGQDENGIAIINTTDLSSYGSRVDNNGAGKDFSYWGSGNYTEGTNNVFYLYPVSLEDITGAITSITWNVVDGNHNILATETNSSCIEDGEYTTTLSFPYVTLNGNKTVTATTENQTIELTYTSNYPFAFSENTSNPTWCAVDIHANESNYVLYSDGDNLRVDNMGSNDNYKNGAVKSDAYMWAFIGNPISGVKLYNKAAQKYATQPNDADVEITLTGEGNVFQMCSTTSGVQNSFALKVDGRSYYFNHRQPKVQGWTSADGGSSLRAYEINDADANYTLTVNKEYGTLVVPFYASIPAGLEVYTCSSDNEGVLVLSQVNDIIAPRTAYIVKRTGATTSFDLVNTSKHNDETNVTTGYLTGVLTNATKVPYGSFILATKDDVQAFYKVETSNYTAAVNKCYITMPDETPASVKALYFCEEADAIKAIEALTSGDAKIYDLNGRQLNCLQKGINIVNGKKIMVK